jgi:fructose-1,6-bisphosphatase I
MERLAEAGERLSLVVAAGGLDSDLDRVTGVNSDGDVQKALDMQADEIFREALRGSGIRHYASEEHAEVLDLGGDGPLALALDPLDGSSNISVNVPLGTIFSIYPASETPAASFLRPAREQIAAGYIIYGAQTCMVVTFGAGVLKFTLDPHSRAFRTTGRQLEIPPASSEFAINASNYRYWLSPVRAYIDDLIAGAEGPLRQDFNMRWVASLVAEAHRIIARGGIFLYPADTRAGYANGRLRMLYECAPIALLMEQAGGGATNGSDPILSLTAEGLHARTPFVFGSKDSVARVAAYHDLPETETSALFSKRGLFRV